MNNMFQIKHKKLKGLNSTGTFAAVNSKNIYIFFFTEQKVSPNQVQKRRVILNMIKHIVDRTTANPSLTAGESLMICHELFCYFSMLFPYVNSKGVGGGDAINNHVLNSRKFSLILFMPCLASLSKQI